MTTAAAPLLSGFSVTLAAVVVTDHDKVRWPGVAVITAVTAAVLLGSCVQFGAWARQHSVVPADFREWFEDSYAQRRELFVQEASRQNRVYDIHARRARSSYSVGITLLLVALGVAVVPPDGADQAVLRWAAACVAWMAGILESAWWVLLRLDRDKMTGKLAKLAEYVAPRP
ncbi:hypothetical protein ACI784_16815 [Geodermatophilus sp. SYSU D01186]